MKIEEAIHQKKPFKSAHERVAVNLMYTHNWVVYHLKQIFKPFGITRQQYNVMRILRGANGPITTAVIRERLLDKMSDSSRLVERLHQKGLVIKRVCPNDKRLVDVSISDKGIALLNEMDAVAHRIPKIMKGLTDEEAAQLSDLLDKVRG